MTMLHLAPAVDIKCYYPDGSEGNTNYACISDMNQNSTCCAEGWECLSNGLCYEKEQNLLARGACTDSTWLDPMCFQECKTVKRDFAVQVDSCGSSVYCCNSDVDSGTCCGNDTNHNNEFKLDVGTAVTTIGVAPTSTSTSHSPSSGISAGNKRIAIGVAVGLGIPLLLALAMGGTWVLMRKKRKREEAEGQRTSLVGGQEAHEIGVGKGEENVAAAAGNEAEGGEKVKMHAAYDPHMPELPGEIMAPPQEMEDTNIFGGGFARAAAAAAPGGERRRVDSSAPTDRIASPEPIPQFPPSPPGVDGVGMAATYVPSPGMPEVDGFRGSAQFNRDGEGR